VPITSHNAPDDPQHGIVATLGYVILNVAQDQFFGSEPLLGRDSADSASALQLKPASREALDQKENQAGRGLRTSRPASHYPCTHSDKGP
jgi:hypothetical protein